MMEQKARLSWRFPLRVAAGSRRTIRWALMAMTFGSYLVAGWFEVRLVKISGESNGH
jgi:hypothetical protein